jgi:hypothetical protein
MLDLLRKGTPPAINRVYAGDVVDEETGALDRLKQAERAELIRNARLSLQRMIDITETGTSAI